MKKAVVFIAMIWVVLAFVNCSKSKEKPDKFPQFENIDKINEGYRLSIDLANSSSMKKYYMAISSGLSREDIELVLKRAARRLLKDNNDNPCTIILLAYWCRKSKFKHPDLHGECDAELIFAPYGDRMRSTEGVPLENYRLKIEIKDSYFEKEKKDKEILEKLYRDTKEWEKSLKEIK